jgi:Ca2+/Na+ antiporter
VPQETDLTEVMHGIEKFSCVVVYPLKLVVSVDEQPVFTICVVILVVYFMVEFIITVMNVLTVYTGLSHLFVGLSLMVWGSENMEMLNLAVALSKGEEELATIAVLSSQIFCITLVIPAACLSRML